MSASNGLIPPQKDAIVYAIAICLAFCLAVLFCGCAEKDPPLTLQEKLLGTWERTWVGFTDVYNFQEDTYDGCVTIPGQPTHCYRYAYTCQGDTLTVMELASKNVNRAVVSFPTDSTCVLGWIGGVQYFLKRL
jgi:hypothetical protein